MKRKVFTDDQGNVSVIEGEEESVGRASIGHEDGRKFYSKEVSEQEYKDIKPKAKRGEKLAKSEVSKIKEEHLAREKQKEDNKRNG